MSAQPAAERPGPEPDDIMRRLPSDQRESFLHDYRAALDAAHETWRYRQLQAVLQLWHLRATAYEQPDYSQRAAEARAGTPGMFAAAEDVIPGWPRPASA
jgi:hypothetical protein